MDEKLFERLKESLRQLAEIDERIKARGKRIAEWKNAKQK